jgi:hypothetical protein
MDEKQKYRNIEMEKRKFRIVQINRDINIFKFLNFIYFGAK